MGKRVKMRFVGFDHVKPDIFQFYSGSAPAPPGDGTGEYVADASVYERLEELDEELRRASGDGKMNFRRMLSNFHVCPFKYNGLMYNSIEHAFHAVKIGLVDKDAARRFSLDSGTELSMGGGHYAWKQRRMILLNAAQIARWNAMSQETMAEIARAKYKQCKEARRVLRATAPAHLYHWLGRGKGVVRFRHLEEIRDR